ncbi:hypothetical protein NM688_g993 [Phlebia brevispora]|uniref:Uncharacterized protein n=1 Tax=Phlebia brevispora TaxID=194682 RepID=A0ACC1TCG7_9APHY|nr:hypothetical protein NM688_g993 [Phlebia brevispora]
MRESLSFNSRPAWKNGGSRGARLNLDLLQVVFGWFGVGRYNVQLRAKAEAAPKRKSKVPSTTTTQDVLPTKGLFLYFKDGWETARVKLGSGSSFDVLPVHTKSGSMNIDHCRYAMKLGARWVFFNGVRGEVTLADQLKNGCFFTESNIKRNAGRTKVVTPAVSGQRRYQLKVQKTMIDEDDEDSQESSEVYMARYPEDDAEPFNWFWFE